MQQTAHLENKGGGKLPLPPGGPVLRLTSDEFQIAFTKSNLSRRDLAKAAGTSAAYISQLFSGSRNPSKKLHARIVSIVENARKPKENANTHWGLAKKFWTERAYRRGYNAGLLAAIRAIRGCKRSCVALRNGLRGA